jgi:gentisate 1,2-dioxygenase
MVPNLEAMMTVQTYRPRDAFARGMAMGWGSPDPIRERKKNLEESPLVAQAWNSTGKALATSTKVTKRDPSTSQKIRKR